MKVQTHPFEFNQEPMVSFQGNNLYIAIDGMSYLLVEDLERVDKFGVPVMSETGNEHTRDEPPILEREFRR